MAAVSLEEAKNHLNISSTVTTHDEELSTFIDRAESTVRTRCGPLVAQDVTERVRGLRPMLSVTETPILSLTSVTPVGGTALTVGDLVVERPKSGVIEYESGARFGARWYDVVYSCGWAATAGSLPEDLKLGTLELLRHLWDTQRGGSTRPGSRPSEGAANTIPGAAHLLPFRVEQLLGPFMKV